MDIGIITIYDAYNYGSFLQAFAMQEFIKGQGHNAYLLDCRKSLKGIIAQKYLAKSFYRSKIKLKRLLAYSRDWKLLNIIRIGDSPKLDAAIIGSDEVWNIDNLSYEHVAQFYGDGIPAQKVIAYGASLGFATLASYADKEALLQSIRTRIAWFGVRDKFTGDFLSAQGIKEIYDICDPTILFYDKWRGYEKDYPTDEDFLIYYSYKENTPYKEYIKQFAEGHGLKVYSVGFYYPWCDRRLIVTPRQFLSLMSKAKYVVTSTFHGTVFSTLYGKKFIQVHPARKAVDYLDQLKIFDREALLDEPYSLFERKLTAPIDYAAVNRKLALWRDSSAALLNSALTL